MTHDPTKCLNLPEIDDLTQFRNVLKEILMNGNTDPQSIGDPHAFTFIMVFLGSNPNNCNQCQVFRKVNTNTLR